MKVRKNRYKGFEEEHIVIKRTIADVVNFKTLPLLEWGDLEQLLIIHLYKVRDKFENRTEYRRSIKKIVKNKLIDIIDTLYVQKRSTGTLDISLSDYDKLKNESVPQNMLSENISEALWILIKDKPAIYSDIIRIMLETGTTKIAPVARELNMPPTTLRYHWNKLKKWAEKEGLKKIL